MTFEDAIEEACEGKLIQRRAWGEPCWVVHIGFEHVLNKAIDPIDAEADDWFVAGSIH